MRWEINETALRRIAGKRIGKTEQREVAAIAKLATTARDVAASLHLSMTHAKQIRQREFRHFSRECHTPGESSHLS